MKIKKLLYFSLPVLSLNALPVRAICPLCIVAIGAGLGLSEYLGIDDTIAGLWIGGFLIASTFWTIQWFNQKKWLFGNKKIRNTLIFILFYGLTIWPLWEKGFIGHPAHMLWGIDKLILGISIGTFGLIGANSWYNDIKKQNGGHAQFPFQKVAIPIGALLLLSLIFYFITSL